jgi:hypothetical protein
MAVPFRFCTIIRLFLLTFVKKRKIDKSQSGAQNDHNETFLRISEKILKKNCLSLGFYEKT